MKLKLIMKILSAAFVIITFTNLVFVPVLQAAATSKITWTNQALKLPGTTDHPSLVSFINGKFIAQGSGYGYLTSVDGKKWSEVNTTTKENERIGVTVTEYRNGMYYGRGRSDEFLTSEDGVIWNLGHFINESGHEQVFNSKDVAYGNDVYVGGRLGAGEVFISTDAITWSSQKLSEEFANDKFFDIEYGNGIFVAIIGENVATSTDGTTWKKQKQGDIPHSTDGRNELTFCGGRFFLISAKVSDNGIRTNVATLSSSDGVKWVKSSYKADAIRGITYLNGIFRGSSYEDALLTSSDGIKWKIVNANNWYDFKYAYAQGIYVRPTVEGIIYISYDGIKWDKQPAWPGYKAGDKTGLNNKLYNIVYGNGVFVIAGFNSFLTSSPIGSGAALPAEKR